jgi:hypothetical protein
MYDASKVIPGLLIFGVLITSPVWYSALSGKIHYVPEPQIVTSNNQCIESKEYMRDNHMHLLDQWRQMKVRDGQTVYTASDGKTYDISLTGTCLKCHSNKEEFCDTCHQYAGVQPNCWDCHVVPEGD